MATGAGFIPNTLRRLWPVCPAMSIRMSMPSLLIQRATSASGAPFITREAIGADARERLGRLRIVEIGEHVEALAVVMAQDGQDEGGERSVAVGRHVTDAQPSARIGRVPEWHIRGLPFKLEALGERAVQREYLGRGVPRRQLRECEQVRERGAKVGACAARGVVCGERVVESSLVLVQVAEIVQCLGCLRSNATHLFELRDGAVEVAHLLQSVPQIDARADGTRIELERATIRGDGFVHPRAPQQCGAEVRPRRDIAGGARHSVAKRIVRGVVVAGLERIAAEPRPDLRRSLARRERGKHRHRARAVSGDPHGVRLRERAGDRVGRRIAGG